MNRVGTKSNSVRVGAIFSSNRMLVTPGQPFTVTDFHSLNARFTLTVFSLVSVDCRVGTAVYTCGAHRIA